ncbi:MAG: M1 family metallopeptidase, partial [Flavobacteriales bacterium]|nr:M1 family metallopeptidase [Flavobacteriales bacterium]
MRLAICAWLLTCATLLHAQDYFQQDVAYTIHVSLNDETHMLQGDVAFEYTNNSPNALEFLWIHVWPNAYKNSKTALARQQFRSGNKFMFYAMDKELGYIDSLNFSVNKASAKWEFHPEHIDIVKLFLSQPLQPGQTVTVHTPFKVKLPSGSISRLGHIDQSYQITQWYPKPAVYDKEGWHEMPYLNQGEFYSEYGSYDVFVTLPKNYVVGATGDLVDCPEEVAFMNELANADIDYEKEESNTFPESSKESKTLHYHQENVHDFAWFADKRWYVRKGEFELPHSGRTVTTWALFTPEAKAWWKNGVQYINDGAYHYSLWNGDYPYNQITAVDGTISAGGGMEYPNVTVIGDMGDDFSLETVIVHEVGHNWFYGILGSNERDNAWMDEGINSFNETRYFETKYGDTLSILGGSKQENRFVKLFDLEQYSYRTRDEYMWLISARRPDDQPIQCHSAEYTGINYGTIVYKKTAVAFDYLKGAIDGLHGAGTFDRAMQSYFDTWKFRHPQPADLQASLEQSTGDDLSWFFDTLVPTTGKPNYKVSGISKTDNGYEVKVKNRGEIPGPYSLSTIKEGEVVSTKWYPGIPAGSSARVTLESSEADAVVVDATEDMIEYDRKDNRIRTSGLLKKVEPLQVKMLTRLEDPNKTQLFWMPVVAWNEQNKFMAGINIHNTTLPFRNWEFSLTPMYAFGSKTLTGFGRLSYYTGPFQAHLATRTFRFNDQSYFDGGRSTSDYYRSSLHLSYALNKRPNSAIKSTIDLELAHVLVDNRSTQAYNDFREIRSMDNLYSPRLQYTIQYNGTITEHLVLLETRTILNDNFALRSWYNSIEYHGAAQYNRKGKKLRWRLFAGGTPAGYRYPVLGQGSVGYRTPAGYRYPVLGQGSVGY